MKILFFVPFFKNTGPANVVASMINELLTRQDIEIVLVSLYPCQDGYQNKFSSSQVTLIELSGFNVNSLIRLRRIVREKQVNVVHSHGLLPDILTPWISLFNGNRKISTVHCNLNDNYRNEYSFPKGPIYYALHKFSLALFDQVISVSSSAKLTVKTDVVYNGIRPRAIEQQPSTALNLVFAGRLIESKNIHFLITAFKALQQSVNYPCQLHIFGDGELMPELQKISDSNIQLHGFVIDYLAQLPANAIVVNPSLFEGMPMAVVEAIACNIPVALSNIDAHQEIASHINQGIALFENSLESFCQAIAELVNEAGQLSYDKPTMQQQFDSHFSDRVMVDKYLFAYQQSK